MSTDFKVDKKSYRTHIPYDQSITQSIEAAVAVQGGAPNKKMVFALIVTADPAKPDVQDYEGDIYLLCGRATDADADPSLSLSAVQNDWNVTPPAHGNPNRKLRGKFKSGGGPQDPATNAFVLPGVNDILVVTYPGIDEQYIGYCTYVGGYPRWY